MEKNLKECFYDDDLEKVMMDAIKNDIFYKKTYEEIREMIINDTNINVNDVQSYILLKAIKNNDVSFLEKLIQNKSFEYLSISEIFNIHRRELHFYGIHIDNKNYLLEDDTYNKGLLSTFKYMNMVNSKNAIYFAIDIMHSAKKSDNYLLFDSFLEILKIML